MSTFIWIVVLCYIFALIAQGVTDREYDRSKNARRTTPNKQLPPNLYSKYSWCEDKSVVGDGNMKKAKPSSAKAPGHVFAFEDDGTPEEKLPTKDDTITHKWELLPQADKEFIDDEDIPF